MAMPSSWKNMITVESTSQTIPIFSHTNAFFLQSSLITKWILLVAILRILWTWVDFLKIKNGGCCSKWFLSTSHLSAQRKVSCLTWNKPKNKNTKHLFYVVLKELGKSGALKSPQKENLKLLKSNFVVVKQRKKKRKKKGWTDKNQKLIYLHEWFFHYCAGEKTERSIHLWNQSSLVMRFKVPLWMDFCWDLPSSLCSRSPTEASKQSVSMSYHYYLLLCSRTACHEAVFEIKTVNKSKH